MRVELTSLFYCIYSYQPFVRGEEGNVTSKKEFIETARLIAKESEVIKMARKVADACTDKQMKRVSYIIISFM